MFCQKQIFSQISEEDKVCDRDKEEKFYSDITNVDDYKILNFGYSLNLNIEDSNHTEYKNLKEEFEEVINKKEKSSFLSEVQCLQNVNIYSKLKESVAILSRVNSQTADVLQLENKEEKEISKEIIEARTEEELFDDSIQEQINAELKALRIQIAKSQAVLAFLQSKSSSIPQEIAERSECEKCFKSPEILKNDDDIIKDDLQTAMGYSCYEQSQAVKLEQQKYDQNKHPPNRSNSSTTNQKSSTLLHRTRITLSCPILPSHTSLITRATQTDPIDSTSASFLPSNGEKLFRSLTSQNYYRNLNGTNSFNSDNVNIGTSIPNYKVACAAQSLKTCLLAVPNAYCFQERVDSPISPTFPRNRSFSFVTAIKKGNPHLVDATETFCTNAEERLSYSAIDSFPKDKVAYNNVQSKVPNIPFCNSSIYNSNTGKDYNQCIKTSPNEDKEYNRPFVNTKNNINSLPPQFHAIHNVKPCSEISSQNEKKKYENKERCELQFAIGDESLEDNLTSNKGNKDDNLVNKDSRTSRNTKRRFSGSGQSHNSSPGIVRCSAFDFSEQEDEISMISTQNVPNLKKREPVSKGKTQMPDLKENSETESAKGSANGSFELETGETFTQEGIYSFIGNDASFPSLPDSFLKRIGAHKDSISNIDSLSDQEIETKFNSLSLAFKTDKFTLTKRLELHQRQRDLAEKNVESELNSLKALLTELSHHCYEGETKELICKMQSHIDIIEQSTSRISCRSEVYGAVQQEERISQAVDIMISHVENLKRLYKKEHLELEEMRNLWNEQGFNNDDSSGETGSGDENKRSLRSLIMSSTNKHNSIRSMQNLVDENSSFWSSNSKYFECQESQNISISNKLPSTYKWSEFKCPDNRLINSSLNSITVEHLKPDSFFSSSENCNCIRQKELNLKLLENRRMKSGNIFTVKINPFIKSNKRKTLSRSKNEISCISRPNNNFIQSNHNYFLMNKNVCHTYYNSDISETDENIDIKRNTKLQTKSNYQSKIEWISQKSIAGSEKISLDSQRKKSKLSQIRIKQLLCIGLLMVSIVSAVFLLSAKFSAESCFFNHSIDISLPELLEKIFNKLVLRHQGKPPI